MLGLFEKKSEHPLADLKAVRGFIEDFPKSDALKALLEMTSWIESAREQDEFRVDHQFAVLCLLDEGARAFERKLTREYFSAAVLPSFQENRMWTALNGFSTQVLLAYLALQVRYRNGDKGASAIKAMMPLLAARGIHAAMGMLKFAAARHALFDQEIWLALAELYAHAESEGYAEEQVELYPGAAARTSVRDEFASALMWYATSFGTLGRQHAHLAERLIAHLSSNFPVSEQREPGTLFVFDLVHPMSPMRVGGESVPQPGLRFLGADKLFTARVARLLKPLENNTLPDDVDFGGPFEPAAVRVAALHLAEQLVSPQSRRSVRHNIDVSVSVAKGFVAVLEQTSIGLDFGSDSPAWRVEDVSVSGMHCLLPAGTDDVEVGTLVATRPDKVEYWGAGIVRRMFSDVQNRRHAGIEMLTNRVEGVTLAEQGSDLEQHALWLDSPGGNADEVDLLTAVDVYTGNHSLKVQYDGRNYLLMPLKLVERGKDYELSRYRKVEEDTAADRE